MEACVSIEPMEKIRCICLSKKKKKKTNYVRINFILIQGNRDGQRKTKHHMEAICSFKAWCRFKPSDKNVQAANFKGKALKKKPKKKKTQQLRIVPCIHKHLVCTCVLVPHIHRAYLMSNHIILIAELDNKC